MYIPFLYIYLYAHIQYAYIHIYINIYTYTYTYKYVAHRFSFCRSMQVCFWKVLSSSIFSMAGLCLLPRSAAISYQCLLLCIDYCHVVPYVRGAVILPRFLITSLCRFSYTSCWKDPIYASPLWVSCGRFNKGASLSPLLSLMCVRVDVYEPECVCVSMCDWLMKRGRLCAGEHMCVRLCVHMCICVSMYVCINIYAPR